VFTQCSKCETVFRIPAEALRVAGGQVRCGRCGEVFNALTRLAENATSFPKGESSLELETRADEILQSLEPVALVDAAPAAPEHGVEIARLEIVEPLDEELASEASLEFTLPPGELDRIFIETPPSPLQRLTIEDRRTERTLDEPVRAAPDIAAAAAPPARVSGLEVSENVRQEMLENYAHAELPDINVPHRQLPFAAWACAAVILAALLAFQMIRTNGSWLAAHAPLLSGSAGLAANLSAYQLRQWGVTGDPAAKGTLRVRASIMNTAAQLQPYPLLRVSLANRFGTRVGQREFEPPEYLGRPTAHMLAPGERVDATLDILDPGKDAEGFEIDVCVRGGDKKVVCAGDDAAAGAAAQAR
jgi:predicted Zn finger-like uncharacterized protein